MKYRPRWSLLSIGAVIILLLFTYPTWRRFFIGRASQGLYPGASDAQQEALRQISKDMKNIPGIAATLYMAQLTVVPAPTSEQPTPVLPDASPILNGSFKGIDVMRVAKGDVTIYRSANGALLLRFDNFSVTNGLDLQVYLSANPEPTGGFDLDQPGVSRFPAGVLKGSDGNQQYDIPKDLNVERYRTVVIFSEALQLIYAIAPLS
jgi:hypothetical protein